MLWETPSNARAIRAATCENVGEPARCVNTSRALDPPSDLPEGGPKVIMLEPSADNHAAPRREGAV